MKLQHTTRWLAVLVGFIEGVLAARLLLKLLAARPDNLVFAALFALTQPFVTMLAFLDLQQPRFGAVLELSTLAWIVLLSFVVVALRFTAARQRVTSAAQSASKM